MKVTLFDFQKDALHLLREKIAMARPHASSSNPQAIVFSAPTGSGKTIMMTALFEAILDQPDDELAWPLDWVPQPDAVILWVSDMPELNEQTKLKIESKSDKVYRVNQLETIDAHFDEPRLAGGRIYFINTQKLAVNQPLCNRSDGREHLIWETLSNTARAIPDRFYVVIDEAHRGMASGRGAKEAQTLMQRFLLGYPEVGLVRMPLVIGLSATPKRFLDLLGNTATHTTHPVPVPADAVRQSGLLKDRILIHHPEAATTAEMALLEESARRWGQMTAAWGAYCREEKVSTVWPILVVQVENGSDRQLTKTDLGAALTVIESAIGRRLNEGEVAHALHDTGDLDVGGRRVRRVEASRIDADKNIGVVFFKTSLSTGWDCPRAEVMMSFRRAEDHTYIAQLLGRMVRTPLARRIEKDAALNDVHLFLPYFNTNAVETVVASLRSAEDVPPTETGSSRDLVVLKRLEGADDIFNALDETVTYRVNAARAQSPLRRYMAIARSLTIDEIDDDAWATAKRQIVEWMGQRIAEIKAAGLFDAAATAITQVGLRTLAVDNGTGIAEPEPTKYAVDASDIDIDRLFEEAGRAFSHGLQMEYWRTHADRDALQVKVEAIVLARNAAEMAKLEATAETAFDSLYDQYKKPIYQLKEQRRGNYEKQRLATAKPSEIPWHLPASIDFKRLPTDPLWERHLYVESSGQFRTELGSWEASVLKEELAKPEVVGWLRNLDRKPWSLEIPYQTGGDIRPMFPDLVVVRKIGSDFVIDVLEPHDPSLADNFEKAVGLAKFAEKHGALFGHIQLIRKQTSAGGEHFVRLEINQAAMIKKLLLITSNPQLDELFSSTAK